MGAYSALLIALFTEMYGVPRRMYLLGSWLGSTFPLLRTPTPAVTCGTT